MTIRDRVLGSPGYDATLHLSPEELGTIQQIVQCQYGLAVLEAGIMAYGDHKGIFTKSRRLMPPFEVEAIMGLPMMTRMMYEMHGVGITNVMTHDGGVEDRGEIYWRIVRPHHEDDVGPAHCDATFHPEEKARLYPGKELVKCWVPLWCERGCGIEIEHKKDPMGFYQCDLNGRIALFGANTFHRGMVNTAPTPRVSLEVTVVCDA